MNFSARVWKVFMAGGFVVVWNWRSAYGAPLSIDQIMSSIDSHYPLVVAALQDVEKSKGELKAAKGGFDTLLKSTYQVTPSGEYTNRYFDTVLEQPTTVWGARIFSGYRAGAGSFGPYDESLLTSRSGEWRAGLALPLLRGGFTDERRAKIEVITRSVDVSNALFDLQRLEARRLASHRFYDWLANGEKLRIARMLLHLAIKRDQMMAHRVQKGDAAEIEQTDNQRSLLQREASQIAAERALEKAALELSLFYRNSQGVPIVPSVDQLPSEPLSIPKEEFESNDQQLKQEFTVESNHWKDVLEKHPEILRLQAQVAQNEVESELAKNSILPKLDAELVASKDIDAGESKKGNPEYKAALKLEFPLLLRSGRGKFDAATAQTIKLNRQLDLARDRLLIALNDSLQAMRAARSRIRLARKEVDLSLKVEEAERMKFRQGDSNILTVNLRENSTADARIRAVDALAEYYRARADFEANSLSQ